MTGGESDSDEALLAAFVAGEDRAFDALVGRYERRVYAICYRYFGNAADAEDALQDAFVALLRRGSTFTGASSFSTWMYRVATNACNDLARKRARRPQRDDTDVAELADGTAVAGIEDQLGGDGRPRAAQRPRRARPRPPRGRRPPRRLRSWPTPRSPSAPASPWGR
jgi:RNA polymerase sigma factor (sigma-70 family)